MAKTDAVKSAALVTGSARRIGLAIAERLAAAGYDLVLHASPRSREAALGHAARLSAAHGIRADVLAGDLADSAFCARLIEEARRMRGSLHLLINNAALFEPDSADTIDAALWDRHFAVNLRAPVFLSSRFAAGAPRGASIVNIIDQRVLRPTPYFFSYTLAKSALWMATQTMAQSFAEQGLRVNAVGPGPVLPNDLEGDAGFSREVQGVPLRRAVDPADVAEAVLYLAGARTVTGQLIAVDSGQHLAWRTPDVAP